MSTSLDNRPSRSVDGAPEASRSSTTDRPLRRDPAVLGFLALSLVFGVIFSVITPLLWGADEGSHVARVWSITNGEITPQVFPDPGGPNYGGPVPVSVRDLIQWATRTTGDHPEPPRPQIENPAELDQIAAQPLDTPTVEIGFVNTTIYSPLAYVPALVGAVVARGLDVSVGTAVHLMRLAGVLAYAALGAAAIATLRGRRGRWIVFAAALVPMSVFQGSTVTTDVMTLGLCLVASALLVKAVFYRDRLTRLEAVALAAVAVAIPLCKSGYIVFLPLVLLVPAASWPWRAVLGRVFAATTVAAGLAAFAWWSAVTVETGPAMGIMRPPAERFSIQPDQQVEFMLERPLSFAHVLANTFSGKSTMYFGQFFGDLGFTFVSIPASARIAWILAAVLALGLCERLVASRARTVLVALAVLAGVACLFGALYLGFSPVGYYIIDGVQGRYFLPFVVLSAAVVLRAVPLRWHLGDGVSIGRIEAGIIALSAFGLGAGALQYGYVVWL